MRTTRSWRFGGLIVIAALTVAGCGGSSVTVDSGVPSSGATDAGPDIPGAGTAPAIVVLRTGGIAGVYDMVQVSADGTARFTSKTRASRVCTPSPKALTRLRAIDLAAVHAPASRPPPMADAFNYSVQVGAARAAASEGDDDSRRAKLVDAAAAVIATCLAG